MRFMHLRHVSNCLLFTFLVASVASAAEPRIVIVFGDSITEGGALPKAERAKAWVNVVEAESKGRLKVINEGKGGRPTASQKEFGAMLTRHPKADVLVLALGTNDSRDLSKDCAAKATANLRAMVAAAKQKYGEGLEVVIVGPPNIRKDALGPTRPIADERDAKLRELGTAFADLAKGLHADFVSLYGVVPEKCLARDGVHPDAAGNEAIARVLLSKLLPADK